jgi:hypothetical protein
MIAKPLGRKISYKWTPASLAMKATCLAGAIQFGVA